MKKVDDLGLLMEHPYCWKALTIFRGDLLSTLKLYQPCLPYIEELDVRAADNDSDLPPLDLDFGKLHMAYVSLSSLPQFIHSGAFHNLAILGVSGINSSIGSTIFHLIRDLRCLKELRLSLQDIDIDGDTEDLPVESRSLKTISIDASLSGMSNIPSVLFLFCPCSIELLCIPAEANLNAGQSFSSLKQLTLYDNAYCRIKYYTKNYAGMALRNVPCDTSVSIFV